jgi:hypothetical protein
MNDKLLFTLFLVALGYVIGVNLPWSPVRVL